MHHESADIAALRRQNKWLAVLLILTLLVALVAAAASVITLLTLAQLGEQLSAYAQQFESLTQEVSDALSELDLSQLDEILEGLATLSDLVNRIAGFFG